MSTRLYLNFDLDVAKALVSTRKYLAEKWNLGECPPEITDDILLRAIARVIEIQTEETILDWNEHLLWSKTGREISKFCQHEYNNRERKCPNV